MAEYGTIINFCIPRDCGIYTSIVVRCACYVIILAIEFACGDFRPYWYVGYFGACAYALLLCDAFKLAYTQDSTTTTFQLDWAYFAAHCMQISLVELYILQAITGNKTTTVVMPILTVLPELYKLIIKCQTRNRSAPETLLGNTSSRQTHGFLLEKLTFFTTFLCFVTCVFLITHDHSTLGVIALVLVITTPLFYVVTKSIIQQEASV